ncbi:unnamed protein product [Phytophthora fragariaefolia]|uniref:Unnamed protein product n=1 Tax=Phytophthora fragariaefolia TaxID=1490495 RepID=A0A9W6X3M5_9STRA|nr:unnamed protein product [Phytophthora fragariaefolia]
MDFTPGSKAPRATTPSEGELASANTSASEPASVEEAPIPSPEESSNIRKADGFLNSSDTHDPKGSASTTPPAKSPQEQSPTSEERTEQQRVAHPGGPMTPKTAATVGRVEAHAQRESHRNTAPTAIPEQQIITDAGIDEGVPPEQLQPDNRRHLRERTQQEASQAAGTKREREASTPRTREQLLALRYWTLNEYREHLRLSRRPGPGVP